MQLLKVNSVENGILYISSKQGHGLKDLLIRFCS